MNGRRAPPDRAASISALHPIDRTGTGSSALPAIAATGCVVICFLITGLIWPHAADGLLRMLLATLAIGFVAARASRVVPPLIRDPYSPFGRASDVRSPPSAPADLRKLVRALASAAPGRLGNRGEIPGAVRLILRGEVSRLLAERYGLSADEAAHYTPIRSLLSEPTWLLVRPRETHSSPGSPGSGHRDFIPLRHLGRILDDLETL